MNLHQVDVSDPPTPLISRSHATTEGNKTGTWRFLRPRYEEKTAPCSTACPAGEDIARIEMLASQGLFKEAWEAILMENPFPATCGRVCFHPCEAACNRADFDEPVAIHVLERFLADMAARYGLKAPSEAPPARKQKIAIIGAGPSGLSAAYFLARLGYGCQVYEAMPEAGGLPRWGIPPYRLAYASLRKEIEHIRELGVSIHCGHPIAEDFLDQAGSSFDAVFLGCGQSGSPRLGIPGEFLEGVEDGLPFLTRLVKHEAPAFSGPIAVIGGGNTAVDVARSLVRLGGKPILVYRRRRQDMPAFDEEISMAIEEGVSIMELVTPLCIEADGDSLRLTLQSMEPMDAVDRAQVRPCPGEIHQIRVARVFKAIGMESTHAWTIPPTDPSSRIVGLPNSRLVLGPDSLVRVFVGDPVTERKSVTHAIASGKEGALALDVLFRKGIDAIAQELLACRVGTGPALSMEIYRNGPRSQRSPHVVHHGEINTDHFQFASRIIPPRLLIEERTGSFAEIHLKISAGMAIKEADRCFNCGICNQCDNCRMYCPDLAVRREKSMRGRRIDYDYCKGCGICVVECPRNAMIFEEEKGEYEAGS